MHNSLARLGVIYKEVGLQPGEKLRETLKDKKETIRKISKEIFMVYSKHQKNNKFKLYFEKLKDNYYKTQKNKLIKELKNITKF